MFDTKIFYRLCEPTRNAHRIAKGSLRANGLLSFPYKWSTQSNIGVFVGEGVSTSKHGDNVVVT